MQARVRVDAEKCNGCRICELICAFGNYEEFNPKRSRVKVVKMERIFLDVPVVCRQCLKPPCVRDCPEDALSKDQEGIIRLSEEPCSGCGLCVDACPFGAITLDPLTGMPLVCNMCNGSPLCVKWCPTGALENSTQDITSQRKRWDTAISSSRSLLRKWNIPLKEYERYYGRYEPRRRPHD